MKRILVCSDIHGQLNKFTNVLDDANYDPEKDQLILLGDYVDRGPDSKGVIENVIELVSEGAIALKGNHEQMMIDALINQEDRDLWVDNGGYKTISSYEGDHELMLKHAAWLRDNLALYHETEDYIFVHAGLQPDVPLEWQEEDDMLWIRHQRPINLGKLVVHGHTPKSEVMRIHDQLFIDTGATFRGKLSLVELPSMTIYED